MNKFLRMSVQTVGGHTAVNIFKLIINYEKSQQLKV